MKTFVCRITAPFACWNSLALRSERISSVTGSHAAWSGTLRGVLGKVSMRWVIEEVQILSKPRWHAIAANELKFDSVGTEPIYVEDQHTPRTTSYLRDVDCLVKAHIVLSKKAGPDDSVAKFNEMFLSRVRKGQQTRSIYLGIRPCVAAIELVTDLSTVPAPHDFSQDLGLSFYDTDWDDPEAPNYFYPLNVEHGIVKYPTWNQVREFGVKRIMRKVS